MTVQELTDDRFSATFGAGRGTGNYPEVIDEPVDVTEQAVDIELGKDDRYVVAFPDGKFMKYNRGAQSAYPVCFTDCTHFRTAEFAQQSLDASEDLSFHTQQMGLTANHIKQAVIKKVLTVSVSFEDVEN